MRLFVCWPVVVGCLVAAPTAPECVCTVAKIHGGWCQACKVGYVASLKIESLMLYETLDNHGHDVDPKIIRCESCKKAVRSTAFAKRAGSGTSESKPILSLSRTNWPKERPRSRRRSHVPRAGKTWRVVDGARPAKSG